MFPFPDTQYIMQDSDLRYAISSNSKHVELAKAFMKYAWKDARISSALGVASPYQYSKESMAAVNELLSYGIPAKYLGYDEGPFYQLINDSEIDINNLCADYILARDPASVIKDYNEKWVNAKKSSGKQ